MLGREFEQLSKLVAAYTADRSLGNIDEVSDVCLCIFSCENQRSIAWQEYLETQHQLVFFTTSERILEAEIESIVAAVGGVLCHSDHVLF